MDLCSGGMIWSCCVEKDLQQDSTSLGLVQNASKLDLVTIGRPIDSFSEERWVIHGQNI